MAPVENGYWGKPTATIDWCENNYEVNFYIAEMYNTVSNLMMIIPPIWGMIEVINQKFEKRFIFCHFLLLVVGLGSWAFHMTLLYEMQLFDELPMVWGTCMLVYRVSEVRTVADKNKIFSNVWLVLLLTSFASLFTAVYLLWPQPIFQHASYGILVITSFALEIRLLKIQPCKVCKRLFILSVSTYLFGFFLWNIDNIFCPNLKLLRSSVSPVIGPFTQLHGWWHFLAGYGTYLQVFFCIHSYNDFCQKRLKKKDQKELEFCQLGFGLRWSKKQRSE